MDYLKGKHPAAFKKWDGFQTTVMASERKGFEPSILVVLYNKPTSDLPTNLNCAFVVDVNSGKVRIGGEKLVTEAQHDMFPEAYKKSDDEEITSGGDRGVYLKQDLDAAS